MCVPCMCAHDLGINHKAICLEITRSHWLHMFAQALQKESGMQPFWYQGRPLFLRPSLKLVSYASRRSVAQEVECREHGPDRQTNLSVGNEFQKALPNLKTRRSSADVSTQDLHTTTGTDTGRRRSLLTFYGQQRRFRAL